MPYLDHAATTPMLPEVIDAVAASMRASSTESRQPLVAAHAGRQARRVVEEARERLAAALDARPSR